MKFISTKDLGREFHDTETGFRLVLVGIPKRLDPRKAEVGMFRRECSNEVFVASVDHIEPWKAEHSAMVLGKNPVASMTVREVLAAYAMQGLLANPSADLHKGYEKYAMVAVKCADALINSLSSPS